VLRSKQIIITLFLPVVDLEETTGFFAVALFLVAVFLADFALVVELVPVAAYPKLETV